MSGKRYDSIQPWHDIDVSLYSAQNEDEDDYQMFALEYRYSDWSVSYRHAAQTFIDALLDPAQWHRGNTYAAVVGRDDGPEVIISILEQMVNRRDEIVAAIEGWRSRIAAIDEAQP